MARLIDLTGQRFTKLTVTAFAGKDKHGNARWGCTCDCGAKTVALGCNLINGHTMSCGCLQRERASSSRTTHGGTHTRVYRIWEHVKTRCLNQNGEKYKWYGGRGITICDEWANSFESFHDWAISNGYSDSLTLDRIDVNGNYAPSNCRWVTMKEQANNRRSNHYLTYNGETHTLKEWSEITGLNYKTLSTRINLLNWDTERALTTPIQEREGNHRQRKD